jgi:hypothetical protein
MRQEITNYENEINNSKIKLNILTAEKFNLNNIKYEVLIKNCNQVEFIIGDYSTTKPPSVIAITTKDMNRGSINNIAAILVHESYHLKLWN